MNAEQEDILRVFAVEATERLDELDELLGEIEDDPENRPPIDQFMRAAHTLKGSAGVAGVEDIAELTHVVESVVEQLRERRLQPIPELFDRLARALDAMTSVLPDIKSGQRPGRNLHDLGDHLRSWLDEVGGTTTQETGKTADQDSLTLGEYDQVRIGVLQEQGKTLFVVEVQVPDDVTEPAAWATSTLKTMRGIGVCVTTSPPASSLKQLAPQEKLSVLLGTKSGKTEITQSLTRSLGSRPSIRPYRAELTPDNGASAQQASVTVVADRTVRVDLEVLDDLLRLVGELMINRDRYRQVAKQLGDELGDASLASEIDDSSGQLGHLTGELQDAIMRARMVPIARIFRNIKRTVRRTTRKTGIAVNVKTEGDETELDKNLVDSLATPLAEFVAGFSRETEEECVVGIRAARRWNQVVLAITSTVPATEEQKTTLRDAVSLTGGMVELQKSNAGHHSCMVSLPLTLTIIRVMMTSVGDEVYAFPIESVKETLKIDPRAVVHLKGTRVTELRGAALSLVFLDEFFGVKNRKGGETQQVLLLSGGGQEIRSNRTIGVVVDRLLGIREVVIKPLSHRFSSIREITGSAILGDDQTALIVNAEMLVQKAITSFAMLDAATRRSRKHQSHRRTA